MVKNGAKQKLLHSEAGPTLCVAYEDRLMSKHVGEEATTSNSQVTIKNKHRCYPKYEKGVCGPNKFKNFYLQKYTNTKE